jgi:hypothetical protein
MRDSILKHQTAFVNGGNAVGNLYANGGSQTDKTGGVVNAYNEAFGGSGSQATLMQGGKGLYSIQGGATPSSAHRPFAAFTQGGGGRRRRRSKTSRKSRKNRYSRSRSRKYGRKRVTKTRSRSRSRRGGYAQYMTGLASSFGQSIPGFPLTSRMSALANPPPFRPYQNCPGGL